MTVIGFITLCIALRFLPSLIASVVATGLAIASIRSSRQALRALIASPSRPRGMGAGWDQRPTAAERRMLARSLDGAIDHCVLTSLLPNIMVRAHRLHYLGWTRGR